MNSFTLILSKQPNSYCETLHKVITDSHIIYDVDWSDDEMVKLGFSNLAAIHSVEDIKLTQKIATSWDKSFYWIEQNYDILDRYKYFYFIEDDVYSHNIYKFIGLFQSLDKYDHHLISKEVLTKEQFPNWTWWYRINDWDKFEVKVKCFSPMSRLSSTLIKKILQWRKHNGKFTFLEIMFSSICATEGLSYLDFDKIPEKQYFGKFHWRPVILKTEIKDDRITHPVKPDYDL